MRITAQGIELPLYHWQRMKKGGELLGFTIPDFSDWMEKILHAIKSSPTNDLLPLSYALRLSVSNSYNINNSDTLEKNIECDVLRTPEWSMTMRPVPYTLDQYEQGVSVLLLPDRRANQYSLNYIKSPELLDTVSALRDVQAKGAFEGVWLNAEGEIMEGTRSNIFLVKKGSIHTPSLQSGCLSGTRRRIIKELANQLQIPFYEGNYRPEVIDRAEEIFLTNALMGIMPVAEIDGRKFNQKDNLVTRRLISHYDEFIRMNTKLHERLLYD
jgi:4-amino-4-deoxychorismate lyase